MSSGRQGRLGIQQKAIRLTMLLFLFSLAAFCIAPADVRGADLAVELRSDGGGAIPGMYVEVSSYSEPWNGGWGYTDDLGLITFSNLPNLDDYVVALDTNGDGYLDIYYSGKYQEENADWIDLSGGDAYVAITLGGLTGYLTDSQGFPLQNVWVEAWSYPAYEYAGGVWTDFEGWYGIWGVEGQQYIISAWPAETGYYYGIPTAYSWDTAAPVSPSFFNSYDIIVPGEGWIPGHIKDGSGNYIAGAWVEAYDASTGAWNGMETYGYDIGGDRNYSLSLPPGTYTVSVYIDGKLQDSQSGVPVDDGFYTDVNFAPLNIFEGYAISGAITGLDLNEYAFVSAWSPSKDYYGEVDLYGDGGVVEYTIGGLFPADDYVVEIIPGNHLYQVYNNRFEWSLADPVDLSSGSRTGIDFSLGSEPVTISGTITFPTPPPDGSSVWVEAESVSTGYASGVEVVLDSGRTVFDYRVGDLARLSDYVVSVWPDHYPPQYYWNTSYWDQAALVSVADTSAENIDFNLSEGYAISGRVLMSGTGLADVLVSAWSEETGSLGETYTGFDGGFTLSGLDPADDFIIEAWVPPYGLYYWGESGTVRNDDLAGGISTSAGDTSGYEILIDPGEIIMGIVKDTANQPLGGVTVSAWSESRQAGNSTTTKADGTFIIRGLPSAGDYDLEVGTGENAGFCPETLSGIVTCSSETDCPNSVEAVLKQKGETYTLSGTVTDTLGGAVSGARVEVWSPTTVGCIGILEGVTDANGNYSISGITPSVDYQLTVWPSSASSLGISSEMLYITGDGQWPVELFPGRTLDGTIYLPDSTTPANNAWVFVYSFSANVYDYRQTLSDGRYEIPNVPTGLADLAIIVFKDGYLVAYHYPEPTEQGNISKDFILAREGNIVGTVTAGGVAATGTLVEVTLALPDGSPFWMSGITDANGQFAVGGLPTTYATGNLIDDYTVTAYVDGYPPESQTGVRPGDTVSFSLGRTLANQLTGTVHNFDNTKLTGTFIVAHAYNVTDPGNITDWTWTEVDMADGSFSFTGLQLNTPYALRFAAISTSDNLSEVMHQWEANGTGIPDTEPISAASTHTTGESVSFFFDFNNQRAVSDAGPGLVQNIRMEPRADNLVQNLRLNPDVRISNSPHVTVSWDTTQAGGNERYYCVFNNRSDYTITKRNAKKPGLSTRRMTSQELNGDRSQFFAHVAVEDNRGRIGGTKHEPFLVDTEAPQNPSVRMLNADREVRSSGSVTLSLNAVNATQMYISNVNFGQGGQWETYAPQKKWKLPTGGGTGTVYVLFRDEALNTSRTSMTVRSDTGSLNKVISALRVLVGIGVSGDRLSGLDGVADGVIDLKDALYHLQTAAGSR